MEHGMSTLVYNNRVDFTGGGSPHFGVAWFIHGFLPPNTIYWVDNPIFQNPVPTLYYFTVNQAFDTSFHIEIIIFHIHIIHLLKNE